MRETEVWECLSSVDASPIKLTVVGKVIFRWVRGETHRTQTLGFELTSVDSYHQRDIENWEPAQLKLGVKQDRERHRAPEVDKGHAWGNAHCSTDEHSPLPSAVVKGNRSIPQSQSPPQRTKCSLQ